jgi:aminopeptidase N
MSNGKLKERRENDDGTETFHWIQSLPIPAYLMTMAASEYVEYKEDFEGLEVSYYAHKKWDKDTVYRSFGKTPKMIKFFEEKLGVKFPWDKYAQITAVNFVIGGMENTSATTQTDATFHDEKAHRDYESDGLVAHELSHMWGGDLVTCRTWSHGWLNEGWGTQMQNEWKRHDMGDEEYLYEQYGKQTSYFDEDKNSYRRPIVQNEWERGSDVFDRHLYPGAAWRYYMLKHLVGEETWWKILGEWMTRYAHKSVYTHDLENLFTEMTGEDFGWFFEQWIYKAGYPECKIKCTYDEKLGHALVRVEQTQKSDDGMTPETFRFPLTVEFVDKDGKRVRYTMQVTEKIHSFYFPVAAEPSQILIDPDYATLMDWTINKPEPMWIEQLLKGAHVIQKIKAAQALAKKATPKAIDALGKALLNDSFWGTQLEIAKALGSIKSEAALDRLLEATTVKNTRALTGVANALGEFYKSERAFEALQKLAGDSESYFVAAAAAHALGKTKHDDAFDVLSKLLKSTPPSWHDMVQVGCLQGLAATEREEVIDIALEYSKIGVSDWIRRHMAGILANLGKRYKKDHPEVKSVLEKLCMDGSYRVQTFSLRAVAKYEDASMIPTLSKIAEGAADSDVLRASRLAIRELDKKKDPTELGSLKKSIEALQKENRDLKDRLSKIEARLDKE